MIVTSSEMFRTYQQLGNIIWRLQITNTFPLTTQLLFCRKSDKRKKLLYYVSSKSWVSLWFKDTSWIIVFTSFEKGLMKFKEGPYLVSATNTGKPSLRFLLARNVAAVIVLWQKLKNIAKLLAHLLWTNLDS